MASEYKNPTEVEMNEYVSIGKVQKQDQPMLAGKIVKAMDTVACLSAEKHAKMPCVTLIMDDLDALGRLSHGQVLNVKARVNRAFGSSMEVLVDVSQEDLSEGEKKDICQACFTFVARPKEGKAHLSHLDPVTMEERLQYALASERRKIRLAARKRAKVTDESAAKKLEEVKVQPVDANTKYEFMSKTSVQSIQLVLPHHANHHQTTFGGQIMAWLVPLCTISASKLCHTVPVLVAVNGIHFSDSSYVGDRLVFKAMVNKTFDDNSMEVGCVVKATDIEGKTRDINSAYLIYVDIDEHGKRKPLPTVVPTTIEEMKHQINAASRRQAEIDEKKILQSVSPALSVPWTKEMSSVLSYHNVLTFMKLYQLKDWVEVSKEGQTRLYKYTKDQLQCVKIEATFSMPAQDLFDLLNKDNSAEWDPVFSQSKTVQNIDEDDKIVYFVMATAGKSDQKPNDLLVLQSSRPASDKNDYYVIAFRSVTLKSFPAPTGYNRKENVSSGFLIQESTEDQGKSYLTHITQITDQVSSSLFSDPAGKINIYAQRVQGLQDYISKMPPTTAVNKDN